MTCILYKVPQELWFIGVLSCTSIKEYCVLCNCCKFTSLLFVNLFTNMNCASKLHVMIP